MQQRMRRNIVLLLFGDVLSFIGALLVSLILRHGQWPSETMLLEHLIPFMGLAVLWVLVFFIAGLYDTHVSLIRTNVPELILRAQLINMLLAALCFFLLPIGITPKTTLALYLIVSTVCIVCWRLLLFPMISLRSNATRAVIIGSGDEAKELSYVLNTNPEFGCLCIEMMDIRVYNNVAALEAKLAELVSIEHIDSVIADMSDEYTKRLAPIYYDFAFLHANVRFILLHELYEQLFRRVPLSLIGKTWFLENIRAGTPRYGYTVLKRGLDIIGAIVLLIPSFLLIFPVVALMIKLKERGPVIYRSERVGQHGRSIHIYKFRTMTGMDESATLDTKHVVTPLGQWLRKLRLDEFPQFWNILWGDLSFVGPRPELPARARVYGECIPYYGMRHLIKPGLSGWAQISDFEVPKGEIDIAQTINKLSFDLYYLKRHSLLLDLEIILKSVKALLLRSGK